MRSQRPSPYKMGDAGGLFLLVKPNGSKLWRVKFRMHGREKLLSLGSYPEVGLAAAREKLYNARHLLANGEDPIAAKAECRRLPENTFEAIARLWHKNRSSSLDPEHAKRVMSRMEKDVFPVLGQQSIEEITPPDVLKMIRKIESRGALDISRRAKQAVGQVFNLLLPAVGYSTILSRVFVAR